MLPQENQGTYPHGDSTYQMAEESIHSQHDDERSADHQPTELDHDDADRRTLDESQADEDDDDQD